MNNRQFCTAASIPAASLPDIDVVSTVMLTSARNLFLLSSLYDSEYFTFPELGETGEGRSAFDVEAGNANTILTSMTNGKFRL